MGAGYERGGGPRRRQSARALDGIKTKILNACRHHDLPPVLAYRAD